VEHVGVREDDRGGPPRPCAGSLGGVPVVGHHAHAAEGPGKLLERAQLVLSQRLGGVEVQGAGQGVGQQCLEHRHVVAQRLAAGGAGRHDHVVARARRVDCLGLVSVEPLDALGGQHLLELRGQRALQVRAHRRARWDALDVDDLPEVIGLRP